MSDVENSNKEEDLNAERSHEKNAHDKEGQQSATKSDSCSEEGSYTTTFLPDSPNEQFLPDLSESSDDENKEQILPLDESYPVTTVAEDVDPILESLLNMERRSNIGSKDNSSDNESSDSELNSSKRIKIANFQTKTHETDFKETTSEEEDTFLPDLAMKKSKVAKVVDCFKVPYFLKMDPKPFDPDDCDDEGYDEEVPDNEEAEEKAMKTLENTIRCRYGKDCDGKPILESNAKMVRWSNGSTSLYIGADIFDMQKKPIGKRKKNQLYLQQGNLLKGQAEFCNKWSLQPCSVKSMVHSKIPLPENYKKSQEIKMLPTVITDPDIHRSEMIKKEKDNNKASLRKQNKIDRRSAHTSFRSSSTFEKEEEENEDEFSILAIKKKYKKKASKAKVFSIYSDEGSSDTHIQESEDDYFDTKSIYHKKKIPLIQESEESDFDMMTNCDEKISYKSRKNNENNLCADDHSQESAESDFVVRKEKSLPIRESDEDDFGAKMSVDEEKIFPFSAKR